MHMVKVFSEELQDTHSLVFLYHYVSTSCKQTNFTKTYFIEYKSWLFNVQIY